MNKFLLVLVILTIISCAEIQIGDDIWKMIGDLIITYGKPYAVQWCEQQWGMGALCGALIDQIIKWLGLTA